MVYPALQTVRIRDVMMPIQDGQEMDLRTLVAQHLNISVELIADCVVVRRALDARKNYLRYVLTVDATLPADLSERLVHAQHAVIIAHRPTLRWHLQTMPAERPIIVGAGPAGLFAALTLAEAGWPPIIFERGRSVDERPRDVSHLYSKGILDPESNVCFGEGGAGTFSDGKLYTRVNDDRVQRVIEMLVERGANPNILINTRPHLGTDKLIGILQSIRARLLELGAELHFSSALKNFDIAAGALRGITLANGDYLPTQHLLLATGHSARTIWEELHACDLPLEARPFAVGFRVEHPQALINEIRYRKAASTLPAADYRLTCQAGDRGVYSFCMCPGGVVVTTPTTPEALCINGMSHASRSGRFANSALVVTVGPQDFGNDVFSGVNFQDAIEKQAYLAGGGQFVAPASRLTDFVKGRVKAALGATSYRRGLTLNNLTSLYPPAVIKALQQAIQSFDKTMPGFLTSEATLIGVETRTASPIRVPRGADLQALGARGLYPAGEGMGYGGGIVSAAVDGMRVAEAMLEQVGAALIS
jgi:uncharacterized protein